MGAKKGDIIEWESDGDDSYRYGEIVEERNGYVRVEGRTGEEFWADGNEVFVP
ncbi:hypothetical protein [Amycolatopsis australiensis]|uniref:Uncharacterized protein n=1 Tax=Amycolatopsis australiensis TaxID=546364 RepID=A0A1K1LMI9_9PSEU|nr:hypothetical protein [Amycolatopsis australiensis]SFW11422.1 hypothetical protein SAMN04489730_0013 [Amycolatopsis australiensis]SFW12100.1 hypothetical protein SAMN04489730_0088 [Amycolatopsis australiensis]